MKKWIVIVITFFIVYLFLLIPCNLFLAAAFAGNSDSKISINEFLSTALQNSNLLNEIQNFNYNQKTKPLSFIEEPEFRVSIEDFEKNEQKYSLRFKPRGLEEIRAEKELYNAMVQSNKSSIETFLHQELKNRYVSVVDTLYFSEMAVLNEKIKVVLDDKETILKRSVETLDFDAAELAAIANKRAGVEIEIAELQSQSNLPIDTTDIIKIEHIQDRIKDICLKAEQDVIASAESGGGVNSLNADQDDNIYLKNAKSEILMADAELRMKDAEKKSLISFIEAAYKSEEDYNFDKAVSIEFGISIPINSGNQSEIIKRKLAVIKSKNEHNSIKQKIDNSISEISFEIGILIENYRKIDAIKEKLNAAFNNLIDTDEITLLNLLEFKENILKTEINLTKLSHTIFLKYIEILDITGKLSQKPLRNYLSNDSNDFISIKSVDTISLPERNRFRSEWTDYYANADAARDAVSS